MQPFTEQQTYEQQSRVLKQHWLKRLYREVDAIFWQRGVKIGKPSLDVCELESVWGDYDALTQHIRLSQKLLLNETWSTTVGVLAHELAHHLAWFLGFPGSDHGSGFMQACDILGVPKPFRRATGDLPAPSETSVEPEHIELLKRVEKLLALAGSANEHEAALAMRRAHDLMLRYNIDHATNQHNFKEAIIRLGKAHTNPLATAVASLLVAHYRVEVIHSSEYDAVANRELRTLHLLGEAHFVDMAEYVFHFLLRTTEGLWFDYKKQNQAAGTLKNSYQLGVINGFSKKMEDAARERQSSWSKSEYGLVVSEPIGMREFVSERFPRLRKTSSGGRRLDGDVYGHGHSHGKGITVNKGVTDKPSGNRRLLLL